MASCWSNYLYFSLQILTWVLNASVFSYTTILWGLGRRVEIWLSLLHYRFTFDPQSDWQMDKTVALIGFPVLENRFIWPSLSLFPLKELQISKKCSYRKIFKLIWTGINFNWCLKFKWEGGIVKGKSWF